MCEAASLRAMINKVHLFDARQMEEVLVVVIFVKLVVRRSTFRSISILLIFTSSTPVTYLGKIVLNLICATFNHVALKSEHACVVKFIDCRSRPM